MIVGNTSKETVSMQNKKDFDDISWENVGLPHSFQYSLFYVEGLLCRLGWYRKQLQLSAADLKKKLFLEFDGGVSGS